MRSIFIIFYGSLLIGCKSEFARFQDKALDFAGDKRIDQKEYQLLAGDIDGKGDKGFKQFVTEDGQVDPAKLSSYLVKFFTAKKLTLTAEDIWQPGSGIAKGGKFNINVFLENSASIDGYVGDNSSFKVNIFKLLTDLKSFSFADSLNLNYINTRPIPIKVSASSEEINDFYSRLNPAYFRSAGGMRGSTDIEKMLKQILDRTDNRNLSVFISDCVFSPGRSDAKKYLDGQYAAIYNDFKAARAANPELSVIILQCTAKFEGTYYDHKDIPHPGISAERPYYIWFIGTADQIAGLTNYKIFELIKNGYRNKLVIQSKGNLNRPDFKILYRPRVGEFDSKLLSEGIISGATRAGDKKNKGLFGFTVAVDFSKSLQDEKYFLEKTNYELSDKNYSLQVEPINDKSNPSLKGYSHVLKLQTSGLRDQTIMIDVVGKTPEWVAASSSPDDTRIGIDSSQNQKTFGVHYLIDAVCDAYYPRSANNATLSVPIRITTKKSSFSLVWVFVLIVVAGTAIYFIKRSKS